DLERNEAATSTAVKRFLRFFTTDAGKKEAYFKKLARFSARLYLFAFEGLEAITALNNPKVMAAGTGAGDVWDVGQKGGYDTAWGNDEEEDDEEMQKPNPPPKKHRPAASLKPAAAHDALASDDEPIQ
ncbi:unnamed protein product, partial [Symbiodinium necroappetens]